METRWKPIPKVELHLHLDCSLSYAAVQQLDATVTPEIYAHEFVAPQKCTSLVDFLARAPRSVALLQTESALRLAVNDVLDQLAADGVIYAEIRFAPFLHIEQGLTPHQVVAIVQDETNRAVARTGVEAFLILCTLRHFDRAQSLATAQLVAEFKGSRVVALDIAGDEAGYPIDAHVPAYEFAITQGLHRTAHAGEAREAGGPRSVWEILEYFKPSRIGHGVRSIEDPTLIKYLKQKDIHLEVCPTSNVQTDIYATYVDHPVDRLYRQGINLGINTDTRTITEITLSAEYARLADVLGWTDDEVLVCNRRALAAAFAPDAVKQKIMAQLQGNTVPAVSTKVGGGTTA